jgi:hypothetical protein
MFTLNSAGVVILLTFRLSGPASTTRIDKDGYAVATREAKRQPAAPPGGEHQAWNEMCLNGKDVGKLLRCEWTPRSTNLLRL